MDFEDRLVFMHDQLCEIIASNTPQQAAIESTFFGKDANATARLGEARGVLVLAARKAGLPIAHYAPAEVKKAVVGRGQATKEQVQFMIKRLLDLKEMPRPLDASDALSYDHRGFVHHLQGNYELAIRDFNRSIALDPTSYKPRFDRGVSYQSLKKFGRAVKDYSVVVRLNPEMAEAHNNRGVCYLMLGKAERAIEDWKRAIELDPGQTPARMNLSILYKNLKRGK